MPPSIVTGIAPVQNFWEQNRTLISTVLTLVLAGFAAFNLNASKVTALEMEVKTVQDHGSKAFIEEKEKYYQQFLQIQQDQAALKQNVQDMREDLREIKSQLKDRR